MKEQLYLLTIIIILVALRELPTLIRSTTNGGPMYKPRWQGQNVLYESRADGKARKQYLEGRKLGVPGLIKSPSRWLSQYERDAFLHGYGDACYEQGVIACDKLRAKETGIAVIPNGVLPNGYYWIRPILTNEQKAYHNMPLDAPVGWRLGIVKNNEVMFFGDKSAWTIKDGCLSFMSFTTTWRGEIFVPHQFVQVLITPPEG